MPSRSGRWSCSSRRSCRPLPDRHGARRGGRYGRSDDGQAQQARRLGAQCAAGHLTAVPAAATTGQAAEVAAGVFPAVECGVHDQRCCVLEPAFPGRCRDDDAALGLGYADPAAEPCGGHGVLFRAGGAAVSAAPAGQPVQIQWEIPRGWQEPRLLVRQPERRGHPAVAGHGGADLDLVSGADRLVGGQWLGPGADLCRASGLSAGAWGFACRSGTSSISTASTG